MCWALSPNALSAHSLSSSKKSGSDFVLEPNASLCHLCLAVACDSGLTYYRLKTNFLGHHPEWDVSADSVSLFQLGQIPRELQCGV